MEIIDKVKKHILNFHKVKNDNPCVILVDGEQVKLPSGKMTWKNKRAARSALTNSIAEVDYKHASLIRKMLEEEGFIKIKEFKI